MKQVRWVPSCITAFGLLCGLFVIFKVSVQEGAIDRMVLVATLLLFVAAIADLLDGAVARAIHAESRFGLFFDSMSDAVTFGIAPAMVGLAVLELRVGSPLAFISIGSAMVYALCGVLRLVRFNLIQLPVDPKREEEKSHLFVGLPIPAAAMALLALSMILSAPEYQSFLIFGYGWKIGIMSGGMVLLAYLMISRIAFPSLKKMHWAVPGFQAILGTVILLLVVIYGIFYFPSLLFLFITWGYIIAAPLVCYKNIN